MSANLALLDTGPVVAYLDASDPGHEWTCSRWADLRGRFVTTGAVLTEAFRLTLQDRIGE